MYSINSVNKNTLLLTTRQESGVRVRLVNELSLRCTNAALCQSHRFPVLSHPTKKGKIPKCLTGS